MVQHIGGLPRQMLPPIDSNHLPRDAARVNEIDHSIRDFLRINA